MGKKTKEDKFGKYAFWFLLGIIVGYLFIMLLQATCAFPLPRKCIYRMCTANTCFIPDGEMVREFCAAKGYDSGWLSSFGCKANEVQCAENHKDWTKYSCVEWGVKE